MAEGSSGAGKIVILVLCVALGLGAYVLSKKQTATGPDAEIAAVESAPKDSMPDDAMPVEAMPAESAPDDSVSENSITIEAMPAEAPTTPEEVAEDAVTIDLDAALAERSMGAADAPVVIHEYSSLTCPHCARFHEEVLPSIKRDYIDTGKVRWVAHDFPLDAGAMLATLMVRCAPAESYFPLVDEVFATQKSWATSKQLAVELAKMGMEAGLEPEQYQACIDHPKLGESIYSGMKEAGQKWQIKATPSFILNDGADRVTGELPYADFAEKIDALLAE